MGFLTVFLMAFLMGFPMGTLTGFLMGFPMGFLKGFLTGFPMAVSGDAPGLVPLPPVPAVSHPRLDTDPGHRGR